MGETMHCRLQEDGERVVTKRALKRKGYAGVISHSEEGERG